MFSSADAGSACSRLTFHDGPMTFSDTPAQGDRLHCRVVAWEALYYSSMAAAATAVLYVSALALRLT